MISCSRLMDTPELLPPDPGRSGQPHPDVQEKIEGQKHIDDYVSTELELLVRRSELFGERANVCYKRCWWILSGAVSFAAFRAVTSSFFPADTWLHVVQNTASSVIVLAILAATSRFAFVMGKSYMVESIRNNNRRHAIYFGQVYLKAFGDKVTWAEAKEAFQSWNIDIGSSFLTQNPYDIDPQVVQALMAVVNAASSKMKKNE
jgi:hypothetical protein